MAAHQFSASALIEAPPQDVYAILADYHHGHPDILPKPPFVSLTVEQGGTGDGTVIRVEMRVFGRLQTYHSAVTEPEPGRVLMESHDNGYVTTFTVDPRTDNQHSYVTITTDMSARAGIAGALERLFIPRLLRPVYVKELANLAQAAVRAR